MVLFLCHRGIRRVGVFWYVRGRLCSNALYNRVAMRDLLEQIRKGLDVNLYYLALYVTLTLPDICAALESDNGRTDGEKYKKWFERYVAPRYHRPGLDVHLSKDELNELPEDVRTSLLESSKPRQLFTAEDCYFFRCSILHQGSAQDSRSSYERILFVESQATGVTLHLNVDERSVDGETVRVLNIDVPTFCKDMIEGVEQWLPQVEMTSTFERNYERFMKRHPNGLHPYIVGPPVIG